MKNQNTNWIRSFTNCYLSGGINFCTISPLSSDFCTCSDQAELLCQGNQIFCHLLFCHITLSLSIKSGASAVTATAVHCDWVDTIKRDTYTSNKGSSKFQTTRISFILGQFHSILFNLCCFIWVFSSLCFAEPAKQVFKNLYPIRFITTLYIKYNLSYKSWHQT